MQYGVGVHGAPPQLVEAMRRIMRGTWHAPGSTTSAWRTSCLQGPVHEDPQTACWTQPIFQWALLFRDKCVGHSVLQRA
eukprot:6836836-Pyramimonas_sp.AAC.1